MSRDGTIVLTGATGFLGMELLVRLLEQRDRRVVCLVRAADDAAARARLDGVLATLFGPLAGTVRDRVSAVAADLEAPGLGLERTTRDAIAAEAGTIVHCAASISFSLPLDEARRINVEGTREIVRLARLARDRGGLDRLVHVSTAYVGGIRAGRIHEDDGDMGQSTRNTYERTKLDAEQVVTRSGVPAAILRPSIVVGDSTTGWTPAFNVIYWPLQAFARGVFPTVPADPNGRVDIVPIDAVAGALYELVSGPRRSGVFHTVAGDDAPTCIELATLASEAFGRPAPAFVPPGSDPVAEQRAGVFLPYFRVSSTFDPGRGRSELGAAPPPLHEYFDTLMAYAREARWGKRPLPRWRLAQQLAAAA